MEKLIDAEITDSDRLHPIPEAAPQSVVDGRWKRGLEWPAALWIGLLHLGALTGPLCFTWPGALLALCLLPL